MKLFALKPCGFGGKKFYIGDEIPAEDVLDPKAQAKMGVLAIFQDGEELPAAPTKEQGKAVDTMTVYLHADEGDMPLDLTQAGLQAVVDVLTDKPAAAEKIINQMTDVDALILLDLTDNRKAIKELAKARAMALSPEDSVGEQ